MAEERVQKILARAGFGSRRACEILIEQGQIAINGQKAQLGSKADAAQDTITVNGKAIPHEEAPVYIALNKPRAVLSDEDPKDDRKTVRDLVPVKGRLFSVGRLDYASEGLILMTNDGELANRLTHPRYGHEKEYRVLVDRRPDEEQLKIWRRGVVLEDGYRTAPAKVEVESQSGKSVWLNVVMHEGRKRQIREVANQIGLSVLRLVRVRISSLNLGNLKAGEWRYLTRQEIANLKTGATLRPVQKRRSISSRK